MMHFFAYIGMFCFGGQIYPTHPMWADKGFAGNLYYLLNFNTYKVRSPHTLGHEKRYESELGRVNRLDETNIRHARVPRE